MSFVIPALDILDKSCVRLTEGDFATKVSYYKDPVDAASWLADNGFERLHLVDLDGARAGKFSNYKILERVVNKTQMVVDVGGGIKTDQDVKIVFESGAQMFTAGSIAVKDPEITASWLETYGPDRVILGADVLNEEVKVSGWQQGTGIKLIPFLEKYLNLGFKKVICTDITNDGTLKGPSFDLYKRLIDRFDFQLIASGGVGNLKDVVKAKEMNLAGIIVGKAIYEGKIDLKELRSCC